MKAFVALVCLIAIVAAQETTIDPSIDCDVSPKEEEWAIFVPNPKDCGSYYACNWGLPVLMQCPEGLHFNPTLLVCDWPAQANCTIRARDLLPN